MKYSNVIAFDTETTGLNTYEGARPFCVSLTDKDGRDFYYRWDYDVFTREVRILPAMLNALQRIFGHEDWIYVAHNTKFDVAMLRSIGIEVKGALRDTVVMAHAQHNARPTYKLKPLCKKLLGFPDDDEKDLKKSVISARKVGKKEGWMLSEDVEGDYALADKDLCEKYAIGDTQRCIQLYYYCLENMNIQQIKVMEMEHRLMLTLIGMETKGVCIDKDRAEILKVYYSEKIERCEAMKDAMGFGKLNTRSPKQMQDAFYEKLKAPKKFKMRKGKDGIRKKTLTCDKTALGAWKGKIPLARVLMDINAAKHELTSFIEPLARYASVDGRVHPNYRQAGTITGRLSCSAPNLQNISNPKDALDDDGVSARARELFIPAENHVLYFPDYSQIEVWVSAYCSQDSVMMKALQEGLDMHDSLNVRFYSKMPDFKEKRSSYRKKVKAATFLIIYGGGIDALTTTIGCSRNEAADFIQLFRETYQELYQYGKDLTSVAGDYGWIENPFGRTYILNEDVAYKALNYMIQGSAADIMKRALLNVDTMLKRKYPECSLLLTIHDEMCIEVPIHLHSKQLMKDVVKEMQGDFHTYFGMPNKFPVAMSVAKERWSEKEEVEL